jgi:hypothetical protein
MYGKRAFVISNSSKSWSMVGKIADVGYFTGMN